MSVIDPNAPSETQTTEARVLPPLPAAVVPHVRHENYKYTIDKRSGLSVEVTAREPSVKALWERFFNVNAESVIFPEAAVRAADIESASVGWASETEALRDLVERVEEIEEAVFDEPEPAPPPKRRPKRAF